MQHNFISHALIRTLNILVSFTAGYEVVIGNGNRLKGERVCHGVALELGELTIVENYLPFTISSTNLILGLKWLATLIVTKDDWEKPAMTIYMDERRIVLRGDPSLNRALVSFKSLMKTFQNGEDGVLLELHQLMVQELNEIEVTSPGIHVVLTEFQDVFQESIELPLRDHMIILFC